MTPQPERPNRNPAGNPLRPENTVLRTIATTRPEIVLHTPRQLGLWLDDLPRLEGELACTYFAEPLEGVFRRLSQTQRAAAKRDADNPQWHSFWFIIRKTDRMVVDSALFSGRPEAEGAVETGNGLGKSCEQSGYMTQTVATMCAWALRQQGVHYLIAKTDAYGTASQRILHRYGFTVSSRGKTVWWRL